jgi:hypothetical protein
MAAAPRPSPWLDAVDPGGVCGPGLLHEQQGGEHLADLVGVFGVAAGELLDRGSLPLPECFHELVRDLPQRVRGGRIVVDHPQIPSMPPGIPWNTSLCRSEGCQEPIRRIV